MSVEDGEVYLRERQVAYLIRGPREVGLGTPPNLSSHSLVYDVGGVQIFAVSSE